MADESLIGGAWLAQEHEIKLAHPLAVVSMIGGRRTSRTTDGTTTEVYVQSMRPEPTLRGHLTFHLKHETPNLELISRLFAAVDATVLTEWIDSEPNGQYARRAGFLFEFLTGQELPVKQLPSGAYVDALDSDLVVTASNPMVTPHKRWLVRDNMPGTRHFCPLVRKTPGVRSAMALDIRALLHSLEVEFGQDLLMRSAAWMTLRESKSSFLIEGEADKSDRVGRFADVLARRTGQGDSQIDEVSLASLQSEILGRSTLQKFGLRQSPVFVGQTTRYQEIVHYIAPPPEDLAPMLEGLQTFVERTKGQSSAMRCAVAAFGFVYIHPLADGNGRVHRFLINDILRRDGAVQEPMILPISSRITRDPAERRAYDSILDEVSKSLMQTLAGQYGFTIMAKKYADGVSSNFEYRGGDSARHAWRYLDLSAHVRYMSTVLERTILQDMVEESVYLRRHALARAAIKDIIEMPDVQIDRVIRSIENNQAKLSNVLAKEIPALLEEGVWQAITAGVAEAFGDASVQVEAPGNEESAPRG